MPVILILLYSQSDEARFTARESVLHRIEHELVEHERHRARALRRQDEARAPELRPYRELPVCHVARGQVENMRHNLLDIDVLAALLREVLMDNGDGEDAVDTLLQRCLYLGRLGPPRLDAQQARDGLQVVLDAVMDLLDDSRLDADFLILGARLRDIRDDDDAHAEIAALADDDLAPDEDEPACRDLLLPRTLRLHRLARDMLRHLAVKEMAAAQAADAEHAVDALCRRIRKDDAAVRIRDDDAIARRDGAELLRIEDVARMVEHGYRRIEQVRIALD